MCKFNCFSKCCSFICCKVIIFVIRLNFYNALSFDESKEMHYRVVLTKAFTNVNCHKTNFIFELLNVDVFVPLHEQVWLHCVIDIFVEHQEPQDVVKSVMRHKHIVTKTSCNCINCMSCKHRSCTRQEHTIVLFIECIFTKNCKLFSFPLFISAWHIPPVDLYGKKTIGFVDCTKPQ